MATLPLDKVPAEVWLRLERDRPGGRPLKANPTAAEVHRKERGAPWRIDAEREIEQDNEQAKEDIFRKRMLGLAVQACQSLQRLYGVRFEPTTLASELRDGHRVKERMQAIESRTRDLRQTLRDEGLAIREELRSHKDRLASTRSAIHRLETEIHEAEEAAAAAATAKPAKGGKKGKAPAAAATETESTVPVETLKEQLEEQESEKESLEAAISDVERRLERAEADAETRLAEAAGPPVTARETKNMDLLDAARRFDLERLRQLLELPDPRPFDTTLTQTTWAPGGARGQS